MISGRRMAQAFGAHRPYKTSRHFTSRSTGRTFLAETLEFTQTECKPRVDGQRFQEKA